MARVYTYVVMSAGLILMLQMAGIPTAIGKIAAFFGLSLTAQSISLSDFFIAAGAVMAAAVVSGVGIGLLTRSSPDSYLIAPMASVLLLLVGTFTSVADYAFSNYSGWVASLAALIFLPIAIGFVISLVEFIRGTS
jgi:hypothetical protein